MISEVSIFDIDQNSVTSLICEPSHIEAPNWTRDGKALIVNSGGRLHRIALDSPTMEEIDTGFAVRCNNDHGISPDGRLLAISDSTEDNSSAIYILPISGGAPKRVTALSPSYWHGWSPDGSRLAYVGNRGEGFCVFTCRLDGSDEFQVSHGFEHCDGPDYTPDGKWIWFNGERGGSVDLWKVRTDGSDLTQMTQDESVNWFPHPSPDGRQVLYLAYENGTKGHPANKNVELRLMDSDGGAPRTLLTMIGGQGSINVPCWAPDSRQFAFVRYRL